MPDYPPPPPYAMLNNGPYYPPYPPPQYYPPPHRKKSSVGCIRSCCRCMCCCCCFLLLLLLIQFCSIIYFYHVYDPKVPSYSVETVNVKAFDLKPDSTLTTDLHVSIRAENPNKNIGFLYGGDSFITVDYSDIIFSAGKLPAFRQGHQNTTVLEVDLTGKSRIEPEIQRRFLENQKNHMIPVVVKMKVPVNVVLGDIEMREFRVFVNCSMVLDSLSPNKSARIMSSEMTFAVEF